MMNDKEERKRRQIEAQRRQEQERSKRARERVDQGRWFHLGMAAARGETAANGWKTEHLIKTLNGLRRHDTARVIDPADRRFAEYKSGRTPEKEALEQLAKDRAALNAGWSGTWVHVEGAKLGWRVTQELKRLQREFPDRFDVVVVSRQQAEQAIQRGKELERGQLELLDAAKLRKQAEQARTLEKAREAQRIRNNAQAAIEKKNEERQRAEEQKTRAAREREAEAERARVREINELLRAAFPRPGDPGYNAKVRDPREHDGRGRSRARDERGKERGRDERGRER
jgi:hypothetical protein